MNIIMKQNQFYLGNLFLLDTKPNIIMDGNFTKIIYSTEHFTMNGVYLSFSMKLLPMKNQPKNMLCFPVSYSENQDLIKQFIEIERNILHYYQKINPSIKHPTYSLRNQLQNGIIKFYKQYNEPPNYSPVYFIKISGIWENNNEIGITYKIIESKN